MDIDAIVEFIKINAEKKECRRIVEVGIGFSFEIAKRLMRYFNVTVVDVNDNAVDKARSLGLDGRKDDIFNPNIEIYKNVGLIYAIRPPRDLQHPILNLAEKIGADVIIRPLLNESPVDGLQLKNYKGEVFYIKSNEKI
ncbi:Protein of unknown function UPF0146 [Methanocaldococcus vulcanius M7]|uniref:UPF0146 protein Metvu_0347 n=1 Tax=Methanocaldococcus vulcanius (strain ATCC 700851 / DSM 12094 / M7) TaxID=579137 RepID=C9RF60_METVM|nr:UPF0146 family protein [Methanocaldococcus vulcanius]ACX72212.1 Protein of unknown function UPF0146 [Methanocaldococcus vulcanius M7]